MERPNNVRGLDGRFAPGTSGNLGGRPKDEARVAELARSYTSEAIETLVHLMRHGKDERVRGTAAQALLDRGWGRLSRGAAGCRCRQDGPSHLKPYEWPKNWATTGLRGLQLVTARAPAVL